MRYMQSVSLGCLSLLFVVGYGFACASPQSVSVSSSSSQSQTTCENGEITVWGEAPVFTSVAATRAKAKRDACRRAVEKCIGDEVASATGVSDGQSILNEIFTQAQGICKHDQALEEQEYKLDTVKMLRVFYRFVVTRADVRDKIDLIQSLVGNPKVVVLIREVYKLPGKKKIHDFLSRDGLSAQVLRAHLISKGYRVIDSAKLRKSFKKGKHLLSSKKTASKGLKDAALKAGADVLVIGNVDVSSQNIAALRGVGLKSYRAVGNVSVVSLWGSGRILGEYSDHQPGAQVTDLAAASTAVTTFVRGKGRETVKGLSRYVEQRLRAEWITMTQNNKIEMTVRGLSPQASVIFREDLREATSVKNVDEITSSTQKVVWELTYPGRSFALADTIGFYQDNPKIFSVLRRPGCKGMRVTLVRRGEIRLRFAKGCQ